MVCKFCNMEVEADSKFCPFCGKNLTEETPVQEAPEAEQVAEAQETEVAEEVTEEVQLEAQLEELPCTEREENGTPAPKKSVLPLILSIVAALAALAALAVVLMMAMGVDFKPRANDIFYQDAYIVDDAKSERKAEVVVATMGDKELTNVQLQIYYRMQVLDLLSYYGSYASQIGFDYTQPLSEQVCYFDQEMSWEQYLIDAAIKTWESYQAMALLAEEVGFELEGEWLETLDKIPADLQQQATDDGYENADALLADVIGPGCKESHYLEYVKLACMSNAYYAHLQETMQPTDADIEAYFAENQAKLAESGITKEMGMISDVRHILIMPKGGMTSEETGETVYTDEEKAAALAEAERILQEWKDGEATEESFGLLANTYSEDGGSNTTGGLYEDIAPGASYVENFLNWSIDMSRQVGDTGIVETEYGYHIMYYVAGEPYWAEVVASQFFDAKIEEQTKAAAEKWPTEVNYKKIALAELRFE